MTLNSLPPVLREFVEAYDSYIHMHYAETRGVWEATKDRMLAARAALEVAPDVITIERAYDILSEVCIDADAEKDCPDGPPLCFHGGDYYGPCERASTCPRLGGAK